MARRNTTDDFDLFGDEPAPSKRKRTLAPANAAAGPSGPAMAGGPSGPAMAGGPSGPAMAGGPSGPAMAGGPSGPAMSGGPSGPAMAGTPKKAASSRRKRSMDEDTFKSLF